MRTLGGPWEGHWAASPHCHLLHRSGQMWPEARSSSSWNDAPLHCSSAGITVLQLIPARGLQGRHPLSALPLPPLLTPPPQYPVLLPSPFRQGVSERAKLPSQGPSQAKVGLQSPAANWTEPCPPLMGCRPWGWPLPGPSFISVPIAQVQP